MGTYRVAVTPHRRLPVNPSVAVTAFVRASSYSTPCWRIVIARPSANRRTSCALVPPRMHVAVNVPTGPAS